jgi:hypothetical protein
MATQQENDATNKAKGAAQAAGENARYQARKAAAATSKVPDKLAKFLKTQRGHNKK